MLLGRADEFERIDRLLATARAGQSGALLVVGEPGIGKTALLAAARERSESMRVLAARGVSSETEVAFAGLLELLRPLLGDLSGVPERQAEALSGALGIGPPVPGDRFLIGAATLSLLAATAEAAPVCVIVDDAHWLDGESLDALLFAVRRLDADAVATLIATRPEAPLIESVSDIEVLELSRLNAAGTTELAESRLGRRLNSQDAARVFAITRGNPLAVIEVGTSAEALAFDTPATLSRSVEDAYARRLRDLPAQVRWTLLVAALDDSLDAARIERAAAADVPAALAAAEESGLIDLVKGRVAFRHPLVRSAVYQTASAGERRRAHAAVARTLAGDELAGRRAWHEAAATVAPDERIAAALEDAASEARDRGGYRAAAVTLERAAHLTPDPAVRARRLYIAAESAFRAGRSRVAGELAGAALASCDEPRLRADIQLLRALQLRLADVPEAYELLRDEARRVAPHDTERAAVMLARASVAGSTLGLLLEAVQIGREARTLAGQDEGAREQVASAFARALFLTGHLAEAEAQARDSIALATAQPPDPNALSRAALSLSFLGEYPGACDLAVESVELARLQGAVGVIPNLAETLAQIQLALGDWDAAVATASEGLRLSRDVHQSHFGAWNCAVLAEIAAARGRRDECVALVDEADALAGGRATWAGHSVAGTALGHLALATGDIGRAIGILEAEVDPGVEQASPSFYLPAFDLVEAYVRANRTSEAQALIERIAPHVHQPWALAALDRSRGVAATDDCFDEPSSAAVEAFTRLHASFEAARSQLCRGERLRRARRRSEARDVLRAALVTFERLNADPWALRARQELEATGETARRRTPLNVDALTPQELQVAEIVAAGATNREAAARLFLSPKTIEAHLHRTYRKLGLSGRADLKGALTGRTGSLD